MKIGDSIVLRHADGRALYGRVVGLTKRPATIAVAIPTLGTLNYALRNGKPRTYNGWTMEAAR